MISLFATYKLMFLCIFNFTFGCFSPLHLFRCSKCFIKVHSKHESNKFALIIHEQCIVRFNMTLNREPEQGSAAITSIINNFLKMSQISDLTRPIKYLATIFLLSSWFNQCEEKAVATWRIASLNG